MCGDGEVSGDRLFDDDSVAEGTPDRLWCANAADSIDCTDSSTQWDHTAADVGANPCGTAYLTARPGECP